MKRFAIAANPVCNNIVHISKRLRISLLTPCLLRVECSAFTDLATQTVWNRDLGKVSYSLSREADTIVVRTEEVTFRIRAKTGKPVSVTLADGETVTDFRRGNLKGTARTLDQANGAVRLMPGIMSRSGVSILDDSRSLLLEETGAIRPRRNAKDIYIFAYGHAYQRQLLDFFKISGQVPLIPKFALGNWWSRYRAYTQEEYRALMERFIEKKIPITVATIDMDWHWTDVLTRFGEKAKPPKALTKEEVFYNAVLPGWTGYTWNTELFPDHKALLDWLHAQNFHVPLNVHPSQGIRFFEECYARVCNRLGKDPTKEETVLFNITDPAFLEAYFDEVHHPLEAEGVDFWWLDWQQGKRTAIPGLDPLWALNHYHSLDAAGGDRRPLILSRYAGLGSHRYPLGFSGDTATTWKSLAFQPYFTNNAANAGYTWWSHDIGGHMRGVQDDELYLRWLQYGVFSPINRLHSTNSEYMGKEPWKRSWAVNAVAERFLKLRHKMIPYLYAANYQTHTQGIPICMPVYYAYDCEDAYRAKNQYIFGGQLLVCPITKPADKRLNLASVEAWLPEGIWTDIFNGRRYRGGRWVTLYRDMDAIPVLAREGAIVPMYHSGDSNDLSLEQPLDIHLWYGNGSFCLYEDDGATNDYQSGAYAITRFAAEAGDGRLVFTLTPDRDPKGLLPEKRTMYLRLRDIAQADCWVNGEKIPFAESIPVQLGKKVVTVRLENVVLTQNQTVQEFTTDLLTRVQASNHWKSRRFAGKKPMPGFVRKALEEADAFV